MGSLSSTFDSDHRQEQSRIFAPDSHVAVRWETSPGGSKSAWTTLHGGSHGDPGAFTSIDEGRYEAGPKAGRCYIRAINDNFGVEWIIEQTTAGGGFGAWVLS